VVEIDSVRVGMFVIIKEGVGCLHSRGAESSRSYIFVNATLDNCCWGALGPVALVLVFCNG